MEKTDDMSSSDTEIDETSKILAETDKTISVVYIKSKSAFCWFDADADS